MMKNRNHKERVRNHKLLDPASPYFWALRSWSKFIKEHNYKDRLDEIVIERWLRTFHGQTAGTYRKGLKLHFLDLATTPLQRYRIDEAFKRIRVVRPYHGPRRVITFEELIDLAGKLSPRIATILVFTWWGAFRIGEVVGIRHADITHHGDVIRVRVVGKGRAHEVEIPTSIFEKVRAVCAGPEYLIEKPRGGPYRAAVLGQIVRTATKAAGRRLSPHELRHSRATYIIERRVPIDRVSTVLGHSDASITARYYIHTGPPSAAQLGFKFAKESFERIEQLRAQRKQERSPWRRRR